MTRIEWTEATWNPIVGCSVVSPGCTNCYAMRQAHRMASNPATPQYHGTTRASRGGPVWSGKVALAENVLLQPLRRRKPTTWFVNSMGDLFHEDVPDEWIDQVLAVMALTPQHTYQVLTKRADRMRSYVSRLPERQYGEPAWPRTALEEPAFDLIESMDRDGDVASTRAYEAVCDWPLPNVWLGVSVEDQTRADKRIPPLLDTPAAIRFVSCEPLLGPVDLIAVMNRAGYDPVWSIRQCGLGWLIVGGESGHDARPMHPYWALSLRDQCAAADVPFFFKQWGEWLHDGMINPFGKAAPTAEIDGQVYHRVGKKAAGRFLFDRYYDGMPAR